MQEILEIQKTIDLPEEEIINLAISLGVDELMNKFKNANNTVKELKPNRLIKNTTTTD